MDLGSLVDGPSPTVMDSPSGVVQPAWKIPLWVETPNETLSSQPLALGIAVPRGLLRDASATSLLDPRGRRAEAQTAITSRWPDGSVRWLLVEFILPPSEAGRAQWQLVLDEEPRPRTGLRVEDSGRGLLIDTGQARFLLDGSRLPPLARVTVQDRDVLDPASTGVTLTGENGRPAIPRVEQFILEEQGPVRATVRLEGRFQGRPKMRFVARCDFFSGTGLVRLRLSVHNPQRARHPGGLWDLGDSGSMLFRDLSLSLGLAGEQAADVLYETEPGAGFQKAGPGGVEIYQDSSGGENWQSRNHIDRLGRVPTSFRGYRVRQADQETFGLRANPVAALRGRDVSVSAAVPEFWQQFPKAIEARENILSLRLFPRQFDGPFELQGGEKKTHTIWLHFGPGQSRPEEGIGWVHHPAMAVADPEWTASAGVLHWVAPTSADGPDSRLDAYLKEVVEGDRSLVARREVIDEYGWRHYGDVHADHEGAYYSGPAPVVSHYNNQYDLLLGTILQCLRGGGPRWADLSGPLARHVADIDIYHTKQDRAYYNGGPFWHTDHYKDAATCTHRSYSAANRPSDGPYGGGPSNEHNYTSGFLHAYYLTGEPSYREAVLSLADWVVSMDDGRREVFGVGRIDPGPTGHASQTADEGFHGPGRGCGNSVNALLDGWLLTGRRAYLDKAEALVRRSVHPSDEITGLDLLETERRWSYTVFLSVLARYLRLKAEAGERGLMYAYGRSALLHYARWMLEHEVPYFDRPEKLEYPTETWAAQEFRKANVLRLAAEHADEPLRSRLTARAAGLSDRAWADLSRFESRWAARPVAILLREGTVDAFFRSRPLEPAPPPDAQYDFGKPAAFRTQKARLRLLLKSPGGAVRAAWRLALSLAGSPRCPSDEAPE